MKYPLLFLLLVLHLGSAATTIYEIQYKFNNNPQTIYTAFLVRYDNSTGFMRVRYVNKDGEARVVEMQFDEILGTSDKDGVHYETLRFQGKSPVFILGNSTDKYNPDYIWFRKTTAEYAFAPWGATSPGENNNTDQGVIVSVKLLNTSDISREYAHLFFGTGETFYTNLFEGGTPGSHTGSLRLMVIANTEDFDIGATCQKDVARVKRKFQEIASFLNLDFKYTEISGSLFGKSAVLNTLNSMNSTAEDIVIVCYTGHGFHYQNDEANAYPQFDLTTGSTQSLSDNTVSLSEVYTILGKKEGHLKLLLADCCNSYIRQSRAIGASNANTMRSRVQWNKSNCESLFINQTGVVVASAASKGEVAYCNSDIGGYFLFNFIESLDKALSVFQSNTSWETIISETRDAVLRMTNRNDCNRDICTETLVSYIKH